MSAPRGTTWLLSVAVVVGIGPWGGLAGGALFWGIADGLGAPHSIESWGLWLASAGFTLGYGLSSYVAFRLVRRSPRLLGGLVAVIAVLVALSMAADTSGWDVLYLFVPGIVLAVALMWWAGRAKRGVS